MVIDNINIMKSIVNNNQQNISKYYMALKTTSKYIHHYEAMSSVEKINLAIFCNYRMKKKMKYFQKKYFDTGKIRKFFFGENLNFIDFDKECEIPPVIYEIIDYLKINNDELGIFRNSTSQAIIEDFLMKIDKNEKIDFLNYTESELAGCLKGYIRIRLQGFFTEDATRILYNAIQVKDSEILLFIMRYIIPSIDPRKRELLLSIIELFKAISKNESSNRMNIENLIRCSAPSFFPIIESKDFNICLYQNGIVGAIVRHGEFSAIPLDLYKSSWSFNITSKHNNQGIIINRPNQNSFNLLCLY